MSQTLQKHNKIDGISQKIFNVSSSLHCTAAVFFHGSVVNYFRFSERHYSYELLGGTYNSSFRTWKINCELYVINIM